MLLGITACGGTAGDEVVVSAASSLTDVFAEMETAFEAAHPEIDVRINFGGSSLLAEQLIAGAPVDVFASADTSHMERVRQEGLIDGSPKAFAGNSLQIATPAGNPAEVTGLSDLADDALFVGLCDEPVPCGRLAREVLSNAGVEPSIDTNEPNVRSLLTKVAAAELDAGIVYVTDVLAAGEEVEGIAIPADVNVRVEYPIASLVDAPNPKGALLFIAFILSEDGQSILAEHGFLSP